jgi:ribosome-associated protein
MAATPGSRLKRRKLTLRTVGKDLRVAIAASQAKKAVDLVVLDLRGLASFTDFFLLATGNSSRQLQTIADAIENELARVKVKPDHVEGYSQGEWILLDYVDFVIHLFTPRSRAYYDLERLWGDALRLDIEPARRAAGQA